MNSTETSLVSATVRIFLSRDSPKSSRASLMRLARLSSNFPNVRAKTTTSPTNKLVHIAWSNSFGCGRRGFQSNHVEDARRDARTMKSNDDENIARYRGRLREVLTNLRSIEGRKFVMQVCSTAQTVRDNAILPPLEFAMEATSTETTYIGINLIATYIQTLR